MSVVRRLATETGEPLGRFEVPNCVVPRRLVAGIEKFLLDNRTGNISLNVRDGKILGVHFEEIVTFRGRD